MSAQPLLTSTKKLASHPLLCGFYPDSTVRGFHPLRDMLFPRSSVVAAVGWGKKANTTPLFSYSKLREIPYVTLEDGFVCYSQHPSIENSPCSLVCDTTGIYYDATQPSDLETMLNDDGWFTAAHEYEARSLIDCLVTNRVSKYNYQGFSGLSVELKRQLEIGNRKIVLVVDQTVDDLSIQYGIASRDTFEKMLSAALDENPDALVVIKTHPDVLLGTKKGYLENVSHPRVVMVGDACNPYALLELAEKVYVGTSQMGMEALMAGLEVHCFGMPFYAGWGLTRDRQACDRRRATISIEKLFSGSYLRYTHYFHPVTHSRCSLDEIISYIISSSK